MAMDMPGPVYRPNTNTGFREMSLIFYLSKLTSVFCELTTSENASEKKILEINVKPKPSADSTKVLNFLLATFLFASVYLLL